MRAFAERLTIRDALNWARYFKAKNAGPGKPWIRDANEIERLAIEAYGG